jgi:hypothetical protein
MAVERREKREREKVNDYSGTIVSERRRWRTHTLGPKFQSFAKQPFTNLCFNAVMFVIKL